MLTATLQRGRGFVVSALLVSLLTSCSRQGEAPRPSPQPGGPAPRPDDGAAGVSEVAVVGTQHFLTDLPDGYTPAHLRLLLTRLAPDVLAVEAPSNVASPWAFAPHELARVTRPWADARRLPIVPAGWHEPG